MSGKFAAGSLTLDGARTPDPPCQTQSCNDSSDYEATYRFTNLVRWP